jgi:hypothetical protein
MGDTRLVFSGIQSYLDKFANDNSFSQHAMAASISRRIKDYWVIMDDASTVSAVLDPRSKLSVFPDESKADVCSHIKSIYELYKGRERSSTDLAPPTPIRKKRQYFSQLRQNTSEISTPELEIEAKTELENYLEQPLNEEADPLPWWKTHQNEFPILNKMARDYLTIQATSVASEQAFSVAGNTITKTRNRLLPETARACLCMKSWLDKDLIQHL